MVSQYPMEFLFSLDMGFNLVAVVFPFLVLVSFLHLMVLAYPWEEVFCKKERKTKIA